jgi:hypothetical protein
MNSNITHHADTALTTDKLDWEAFRYIANEMTSAEVAAFEQLLATDQAAREAVATAVEISQTIHTAESLATTPIATAVSPAWFAPVAWASLGAAACLAIVGLSSHIFLSTPQKMIGNAPASAALAEAWSEQSLAETSLYPREVADWDALFDLPEEPESPLAENHAPGWMLEAVQDLSTGNDSRSADEEMES